MSDPTDYLFPAFVLAIAGTIHGLVGFGSGLVASALLAFLWDMKALVGIGAVMTIATVLLLGWKLRRHITWPELMPLLAGSALGVPIGVWVLHAVSGPLIRGTLGLVILAHAAFTLLARPDARWLARSSPRWAVAAGFLGGIFAGAFNAGATPVVIYGTERGWSPDAFRAQLQGFFMFTAVIATLLLGGSGSLPAGTLLQGLALFPCLVFGTWLGDRWAGRVDRELFRKFVLYGLMLLGLALCSDFALAATPHPGAPTAP